MGRNLFVSQLNYVTILCTYYWCDVTASLARVVKFIQQVDGNLESNKDTIKTLINGKGVDHLAIFFFGGGGI